MSFSLRDLFGIVALTSVLAWCAMQVGFDNGMYWMAVVSAAALSTVFVSMAQDERRRRWAPITALLCPVLCCTPIVFSLSTLVNGVLLLLPGTVCAFGPLRRPKTLWAIALSCSAASLVAGVLPGMFQVRSLEAMRDEFPIVPLQDRLQYERAGRDSDRKAQELSLEVESGLDEMEGRLQRSDYRRYQLEQIHSRQHELFVRAVGFGVGRMLFPSVERVRRPELRDVAFNERLAEVDHRHWHAFIDIGESSDIEILHDAGSSDFLDPDSFGVLIGPGLRVAGFIEHAFHYSPGNSWTNPDAWIIDRIELVSLLKFEEPQVYVLDHLPRMDEIASEDVRTRSLDEFEREALSQLHTEKDIEVVDRGKDVRMLGSLRAANQCLDCHTAQRGDLLGALSYQLRRMTE